MTHSFSLPMFIKEFYLRSSTAKTKLTINSLQTQHLRSYLNSNTTNQKKILLKNLLAMKQRNEKISMLTAYDYNQAMLADYANIDCILVGDSCANVIMGLKNTNGITMNQMIHHCQSVARGVNHAYLIADMPFGTYLSKDDALRNAGRLISEGGASCVKLEGFVPEIISAIAKFMPVCGHLGLLPQTHDCFGTRGRTYNDILELADQALALQESGCSFLVLEKVCAETAFYISSLLNIPTIGIGSGVYCDGQVLVWHDMLGLQPPQLNTSTFKFVKKYCNLAPTLIESICEYIGDVKGSKFPSTEHSYYISDKTREKLINNKELWVKNENIVGKFGNNPQLMFDQIKEGCIYYKNDSNDESVCNATEKPKKQRFRQLLPTQNKQNFTKVITSIAELKHERESAIIRNSTNIDIIFVPFLGGLHSGHLSLIEKAKDIKSSLVSPQIWCSLFLNPTQFNSENDLLTYPLNMDDDIQLLVGMGVDIIFTPKASEIYPNKDDRNVSCFVDFNNLECSEDVQRPGHFRGMATVVTKLLALIQPKKIIVGQKDFMQCILIRNICQELFFDDIKVVVHETVRDVNDGLALSSRNDKLSEDERVKAPLVYQCLCAMGNTLYHVLCDRHQCVTDGILVSDVLQVGYHFVDGNSDLELEYIVVHDEVSGRELTGDELMFIDKQLYVISIAGRVVQSETRLIDNIVVGNGYWQSFKHFSGRLASMKL